MPQRTCTLPDCDRPLIARELCSMHYQRLVHRGTTEVRAPRPPKPPCSVDDCGKPTASRGWCHMHYRRWRMNGTLDDPTPRPRRSRCAVQGCDVVGRTSRGLCARHYARWRTDGDPGEAQRRYRPPATSDAVCEIKGCNRGGLLRRGWCTIHYQRWQKHGDPTYERPAPAPTCSMTGCEKPHDARGLCSTHYVRWWRTGTPDAPQSRINLCSVEGCADRSHSRGLCAKHHARWQRHGTTDQPAKAWTRSATGRCEIVGCNAAHQARGLCAFHYQQERHDETRDVANARMRAHYQANREYYFAKGDERRGILASLSGEDRAISAGYRRAIANDPCAYCGGKGEHNDHVFPLAKGGSDHWWNLVRACAPCNKSKAAHCGTWFRLRRGIRVAARPVPTCAEAG